jgi:ribosomal protein S18 acetylase RimI-like enzyme
VNSATQRIVTRRLADADLDAVVALSLAAWASVFASLEEQLGPTIFTMIYPDWRRTQAAAVRAVCVDEENDVRVACVDDQVVGFVAVGLVAEDAARAGEIHMIAVDPGHQRAGVGSALMRQALAVAEAHGVQLAVIATGGDPGHAPARALYERFGFRPLPGVRYYRAV